MGGSSEATGETIEAGGTLKGDFTALDVFPITGNLGKGGGEGVPYVAGGSGEIGD